MSRKQREDRSSWKVPSIYTFVGNYGPFRTKGYEPIERVMVLLHNSREETPGKDDGKTRHAMYNLAGQTQKVLLEHDENNPQMEGIVVVDIQDMFESEEEFTAALVQETEEVALTKSLGKALQRLLHRMLLKNITLAAKGSLCVLLWKLYRSVATTDPQMISDLWMLHPALPAKFVNTHMAPQVRQSNLPLHLVMDKANNPRVDMLRCFFPKGTTKVVDPKRTKSWLSASLQPSQYEEKTPEDAISVYDPDMYSPIGKSLFLSKMTVEMSRQTKQYERICEDITSALTVVHETVCEKTEIDDLTSVDWSTCERHIGALVLRGNRCVLVRSLEKKWEGMRIPSVRCKPEEAPIDAAIRAVMEFTGVDANEVTPLSDMVLPVPIYGPNARPIMVTLYPLYATQPPPDGPLEDADMEDDETPYDWYLLSNAIKKLDTPSIAALQTMALSLMQAANVGLIPLKWGGVFGQELPSPSTTTRSTDISITTTPSMLTKQAEEWTPSRQGDILQDVRKANQIIMERLSTRGGEKKKLPVTILSGFLGSGKTTLLTHILSNYDGLRVAILVNDMAEINIDAAVVKSTVSIRQREEHMVELSNGCVCCSLRNDLLVEVASIAADGKYDYLLIEATGISEPMPVAETFTFKDSTGLCLGDVAEIDTLVTVVDGSRFLSELDSLESLLERNWQADPEDQRSISHLLCDQVEFANVVVLNKCDLIKDDEKRKVHDLIKSMNPTARLLRAQFGAVPLDSVLGTGLFSLSEAQKHENWLKEGEHVPETEEYGIASFTYRATKPFNPSKLHHAIESMLDKSEAPFDTSIVLRAKGFIWLASCNQLQGDFSLAGNHYSLLPGNPWWAEIEKCHWPENLERDIAPLWREPHGDRQQEIVIIGQSLQKDNIIRTLNTCLLSDEEFEMGPKSWEDLCNQEGDPFQDDWQAAIEMAIQESHNHDHGNDHGHDHDHSHSH